MQSATLFGKRRARTQEWYVGTPVGPFRLNYQCPTKSRRWVHHCSGPRNRTHHDFFRYLGPVTSPVTVPYSAPEVTVANLTDVGKMGVQSTSLVPLFVTPDPFLKIVTLRRKSPFLIGPRGLLLVTSNGLSSPATKAGTVGNLSVAVRNRRSTRVTHTKVFRRLRFPF